MAPILDKSLIVSNPETILSHPLPVWYEDVKNGIGNGIVSERYREVLGASLAEHSWVSCVLNPEYAESYLRFCKRREPTETWIHPLKWKRPDNGEIIVKEARAKWISEHEILGEVNEPLETNLPTHQIWIARFVVFILGVLSGFSLGVLWRIN